MAAPITIVIPTLNAAATLPATLASLMPGIEAGLVADLIVSDGGSNDDTLKIANDVGAELVTGAVGRGGQLERGTALGRGQWLLLLHADTVLTPDWIDAARDHLDGPTDEAGYFQLKFRAKGLAPGFVAFWANTRARLFGLPYGDQGLLISRDTLHSVGGVPDIPLMEDVALARALRGRLKPLAATALTSAERYERDGWLRRGARNLWILARYLLGANPKTLARAYQGRASGTD